MRRSRHLSLGDNAMSSTRRVMRLVRSLGRLGFVVLVLTHSFKVFGAEPLTPHFAFSNYFGSGLYNASGSDVTVFNIPTSLPLDKSGWEGTRLRLPTSIGLTNFDIDNVGDTRPVQDAATITQAVGLEKHHWDNKNLRLVPFFDLGYSKDLRSSDHAFIYALGISAYRDFSLYERRHTFFSRVQTAGFTTRRDSVNDTFSSLQFGFDLKLPPRIFIGERQMFFSVYGSSYLFLSGVEIVNGVDQVFEDDVAHEVGFTWGLRRAITTALFDIQRLGLGYRFSKSSPGILHLTFNFPMD
jgi:hypothetical protein